MKEIESPRAISRPFVNLWRCYALSHGLEFILETEEGLAPAANWRRWFAAERFLPFYEGLLRLVGGCSMARC